jgi:hypothetical protein
MRESLQEAIRRKLEELAEYSYSDGCVKFKMEYCTPDEAARISNSGMLDTLARILADVKPLHKLTPEEKADIEAWLPTEEQAAELFRDSPITPYNLL